MKSDPSFFESHLKSLAQRVDTLRNTAYNAKRYDLSSQLQSIQRSLIQLSLAERLHPVTLLKTTLEAWDYQAPRTTTFPAPSRKKTKRKP